MPPRLFSFLLDLIAPPLCVACDAIIASPPLCTTCAELLQPCPDVICHHCGVGVPRHTEDLPYHGDLCERCIHFPPHFTMARAAFDYDGLLSEVLPSIKYGRHEVLMHHLSALMIPFGVHQLEEWFESTRSSSRLILAPMPMHWRAVMARGFSQTMILTEALARKARHCAEFSPHTLTKTRHTAQQAGLSLSARRTNLAHTIHTQGTHVRGRAVVIVDDVMTSGSSADEAARALQEAGATHVFVLTLARATH